MFSSTSVLPIFYGHCCSSIFSTCLNHRNNLIRSYLLLCQCAFNCPISTYLLDHSYLYPDESPYLWSWALHCKHIQITLFCFLSSIFTSLPHALFPVQLLAINLFSSPTSLCSYSLAHFSTPLPPVETFQLRRSHLTHVVKNG